MALESSPYGTSYEDSTVGREIVGSEVQGAGDQSARLNRTGNIQNAAYELQKLHNIPLAEAKKQAEGLADIADQNQQLDILTKQRDIENRKQDLNWQTTAAQKINELDKISHTDLKNFDDNIRDWTAKNLEYVYGSPKVSKPIQDALRKKVEDHTNYAGGVATELKSRGGYLDDSMLDDKTGQYDHGRAAKVIANQKQEQYEPELAQAQQTAQATADIREQAQTRGEQRRSQLAEERAKYNAQLRAESSEGQRAEAAAGLQASRVQSEALGGIPKGLINVEPTLTSPSSGLQWYRASEKGGQYVPDENGDMVIYKNKADKKNPVRIISYDDLQNVKKLKSGGQSSRESDTSDRPPLSSFN